MSSEGKELKIDRKKYFILQRIRYIVLKFGELSPRNDWDYVSFFNRLCKFSSDRAVRPS